MIKHETTHETLVPHKQRALAAGAPRRAAEDPRQRRLMVVTLVLLLSTLGAVLYWDRTFWFPDTQEADSDQPADQAPPPHAAAQQTIAVAKITTPPVKAKSHGAASSKAKTPAPTTSAPAAPVAAATTRTVLPPLEVEVIAGDTHRTVRPGSNSVRVDLQPGAPTHLDGTNSSAETAANVTTNAAERVQMSADTTDAVTHTVKPGYPLLARQMKIQGSVILRALISKEGTIQDLHVLSGPTILASAAQDAVRQWHFKPHYQGDEAVETQARITVNFTISTN
jgi:TonB family protein